MKLSLTFLAVLAVFGTYQVHSVPLPSRGLSQDLEDFLALLPEEQIIELFFEYMSEDEDFGEAVDYVLSDDFKSLVISVEAMPEIKSFMKYLQQAGLDVYELVNKLHDLLGIDRINLVRQSRISGGLAGFMKDLTALLPLGKIQNLYQEKLETSEEFAALIKQLKSPEFQAVLDSMFANPELQKLINIAESKGVDVQGIFDVLRIVLGLKFPHHSAFSLTRNLQDDLNDFLSLMPVEALEQIFYQYLAEDEDFGEVIDYVLSDDFRKLVVEVEGMSEIKDLLDFLQASGLEAYKAINTVNDLLGIDRVHPLYNFKFQKITGGLPGFIEDLKAVLPWHEIEEMYHLKLKASENFASLVKRLQSVEFQELTNKLLSNPMVKDLIKRAEALGVDIQAIADFLTSIFGPKTPERSRLSLTRDLNDDLNDLLALVPAKEIEDLFYDYLSNDEDFGEALDYVLSEEFKGLVIEVEGLKEIKGLLEFLESSGLDAYSYINQLNDLLGIDHIAAARLIKSNRITGGLPGFIQDVTAILPMDKIQALYNKKLQTSEDFKNLITRLKSQEFQGLVDKLLANSALQNLIKRAEAKGVDVQAIFDFLTTLLGLKFPERPQVFSRLTRNLNDDLNDLLALVPTKEIEDLFYDYLSNDEDFGEALDYVLSDEFKGLVIEVEGLKEIKGLLEFLESSGLDAYSYINQLNDLLGIDHIAAARLIKSNRITGGLPGFIQDVTAILPIDKIEALYNKKLQTSEDFKKLITRLKSQEFQGLVDKLLANSALQNLIKRAEAKGVDVQAIFDFLTTLLGLKFPERPQVFSRLTRNLNDDLNDLLALVPTKEIEDLFYDYLSNDEDFGEALDYVLSDEFKGLVIEVEGLKEIKGLLEFLESSGLDAYSYINQLNDLLGIDHIATARISKNNRITGGLPGFIQDVTAILPMDKIEALYNKKLQTSEDFKKLITRLQSQEFQGLVDKLLANSALQNLIKRAESKGVDVQAIFDFLTTLLGLKFPERPQVFLRLTRNLKDDLYDFLALVPLEKVEDLFYEYLSDDEDFGEALDYLISDEFKTLISEIEALPEVKELVDFLQSSGLDACKFIEKLNELLGLGKTVEVSKIQYKNKKITGGLPGFIEDIKALLPIEKIEKLYDEKLETSADFKTLIQRLKSKEFQGLVDKLMANPTLQNLITRAEAKGVDVKAIFDFFTTFLGLKFPARPAVLKVYRNAEVVEIIETIWSLVPIDDIFDIILDYMLEDQDFGKVMNYMLSEKFQRQLSDIEDLKEMRDVLVFLDENGLEVYEYLNSLNDLIGLDKHLPLVRTLRITGGVNGLFEDIWAKLPREELWDLWDEKMATSKAWKEFVNRLETQELQNLMDRLHVHDGFQEIVGRLEKLGVDWVEVEKIINTVIGIKFPTRPKPQ